MLDIVGDKVPAADGIVKNERGSYPPDIFRVTLNQNAVHE